MTYRELEKNAKQFFPVIFLDRIIPAHQRKAVREGALIIGLIIALGLIAGAFAKQHLALGGLSLCAAIWLSFFALEAFFNSYYFEETPTVLREPLRTQHTSGLTFDVAGIIYRTPGSDATRGFLQSPVGRTVLSRLGIDVAIINAFLISDRERIPRELIDFPGTGHVTLSRYVETLILSDKSLTDFFTKQVVTKEQVVGASRWVERLHDHEREQKRFWGRDTLGRVRGIGKSWAYGGAYILAQYALPIESAFRSAFRDSSGDIFQSDVDIVEAILARSDEANCLVVSDDKDAAMELVAALSREIREGTVLPTLEHKRVMVLDDNLLIADVGDKESFERRIMGILQEVITAGDLILVIDDLPAFLQNATRIGSDFGNILSEYIRLPSLQLIALTDSRGFHDTIDKDKNLSTRFEQMYLEQVTVSALIRFLAEQAEKLESEYHVFFTYQIIETLAKTALNVFNSGVRERSLNILSESAQLAAGMRRKQITEQDVLSLAEDKSRITLTVSSSERHTLLNLEEVLKKRIVGQEEAISGISGALRRSRAGISNPKRPVGSFLFLGPTGVGKTETTKALAASMFGSEENIVRFDMSEYQSEDGLNRLIGGFGKDGMGLLASRLRDNPQGVLLLDEFEKTHPKVLDLFLQILDEGMFTDAQGERVNVRHMLIIATSNAGSDLIWDYLNQYKKEGKSASMSGALMSRKDDILDTIIKRNIFKPELLNRFDSIVLFHPLSQEQLAIVTRLMLGKLAKRIETKGYTLEITDELVQSLAEKGNDQRFGARALNRVIQDKVEQVIADKILAGKLERGNKINISSEEIK